MEDRGRKQGERAPGNDRTKNQNGAAWLASGTVSRFLQVALGLVAGLILVTMAVQFGAGNRSAERDARERITVALEQGSVPLNLFFSETRARLSALEAVAGDAPGNAFRLDSGYRRYDGNGAPVTGGPALPAIAGAAAIATETGFPALSQPFEVTGQWYAAIVKERRGSAGTPAEYDGVQFPLSRMLGLWAGMRMPPGFSRTLLARDGRIWLRDPFVPGLIGAPASNDPFAAAVTSDSAYITRIVEFDEGGVDALVGWRPLEAFGLVLAVGVDRDQLAGGDRTFLPLLAALFLTGGMLLLVTFAGRYPATAPPAAKRAPQRKSVV